MVGGVSSSVGQSYGVGQTAGKTAQVAANQNQTAITPAKRTASVEKERLNPIDYQVPKGKEGVDPQEAAVRGRITEQAQLQSQLAEAKTDLANVDLEELQQAKEEQVNNETPGQCECCRNRRYQDGSNDGSVSYQTPTHISASSSGSKVMAHEQEHVTNEQNYAERAGREVVSQNVRLDSSVCPECGCSYTSGGMTTTVTAEATPPKPVENKISLSSQSVDRLMQMGAS